MTFKQGQIANPHGGKSHNKSGIRALAKIRTGLNKAIDGLGDAVGKEGTTRLAELITEAMERDIVGTLKGLAFCLPKDIQIDVNHSNSSKHLTDDDLADIIMERMRLRQEACKTIEGELVETDINQEVTE